MFKFNKSSGQVSRLLLVLAVIILVAVIIVYLVMKMAEKPAAPKGPAPAAEVPLPVYEKQLGNIRFVFQSALDRQQVLPASQVINTQAGSSIKKDLMIDNLGAKFIQVTVGGQNKGTENTVTNAWDIENIVDSENRNFVPLDRYIVGPWLPAKDLCGALLKPEFDPTPCTKIYEVSKASTGLKIRVQTGKNNNSAINSSSGKIDTFLLDLIVK
jgi:hypothetical protein